MSGSLSSQDAFHAEEEPHISKEEMLSWAELEALWSKSRNTLARLAFSPEAEYIFKARKNLKKSMERKNA
eukprot:12905579-Prorocentrum_lima.AAC.1